MNTDIKTEYLSDQVQRTLRIVKVLAGHELTGLSPSEMAEKAEVSRSNITRILANLQFFNWVETVPGNNKRFRLSPGIVQIANTVQMNLNQAQQELQKEQHNYTRLAL